MAEHDGSEQAVILGHAGDIAHALGKLDEAAAHWQRALDLTPEDVELQRKLGDAGSRDTSR